MLLTLPGLVYIQHGYLRAWAVDPIWLALICTKQQLSIEASMVLYDLNHFHFTDLREMRETPRRSSLLRDFFNSVGTVDSSLLSYIPVDFPNRLSTEISTEIFCLRRRHEECKAPPGKMHQPDYAADWTFLPQNLRKSSISATIRYSSLGADYRKLRSD